MKYFAYHKERKLPFHWTSVVPKHYKKNVITGDLHRVKNLSSNFKQEVRIVRDKYIKADYPSRHINSIIDGFNQEKDLLIPTSLFEGRKVSFQIPFCKQKINEISRIMTNWKRLLTIK